MIRVMLSLRHFFGTLLLLAGLAVAGQAVAGAAAGYSDCCLHGCDGLMHCSSAACQACAAPQVGPAPVMPPWLTAGAAACPLTPDAGAPAQARRPWTPPD